jgi:hydrogenase/urease accessory protein HupE
MIRLIASLFLALMAIMPAHADELRPGYLDLTETTPNTWSMIWKAPINSGLALRATPALPTDCIASQESRELEQRALVLKAQFRCHQSLFGRSVGLKGIDATFTDALLRVAPLDGRIRTARLTPDAPSYRIEADPSRLEVARTYLLLGIEHILFGWDHLLFVVALVMLLRRGWTIAKAVTAFTLAHSITLVGSTLGFLGLPQAPVESVIALSIMFLCVEIIKARPGETRLSERVPWIVAFLFGLLHGFGFAGALAEIGLPHGEVPVALLTFNLGVEGGQLVIVTTALVVIALIRRLAEPALRPAITVATYATGITASYWFIERTLA